MNSRDTVLQRVQPRLDARRAEHAAASRAEGWAGNGAVVLLVAGLGLLSFSSNLGPGAVWAGGGMLAAIVPLVAWRGLFTRRRRRLGYAVEWMERAMRRLGDEYQFGQDDGASFADPQHPFSGDLDLFGAGSLFHRANACQTLLGRRALAELLAGELPGESPAARRAAIEELRDHLDFREAFEVELRSIGEVERSAGVDAARLRRDTDAVFAWADAPPPPQEAAWKVAVLWTLAGIVTAAFLAKLAFDWPWGVVLPFYAVNFLVLSRIHGIEALENRFSTLRSTLLQWSRAIACLEKAPLQATLLAEARDRLLARSVPSSAAIAKLGTLVDSLLRRRNVFWSFTLGILWLWDYHARRRLFEWQREHGPQLREWMRSVAFVEACSSLGAYAEAVPEQPFAEFHEDGPWLAAQDLAHPLLSPATRVGNDLELSRAGSVLLVTGSNMSGKSTLLRAAGLAAVMARLGLPVAARSLRLRELATVTCMRVEDSLQEGSSRFHAEVKRLKFCVDQAASGRPTVVILDEILAGTNSRDRHAGTLAVLHKLTKLDAITLVSTHDLELAELREAYADGVEIAHFCDEMVDGVMSFDYRLRPGALPASNALEVMRLAGLDVPASS